MWEKGLGREITTKPGPRRTSSPGYSGASVALNLTFERIGKSVGEGNCHCRGTYSPESALWKSVMMSSEASMPTEIRTMPSVIPTASLSSGVISL